MVVAGDFQRESGARAVGVLLDERGAKIDVVVAASDAMALGAIDALRARGLAVPGDVAVAGFDDVEEARFSAPALTTVRQPLHEQGRRAVELLCAKIRGEAVPEQVTLHTEIVTRQSCGCSWRWARRDVAYEPTPPSVTYEIVGAGEAPAPPAQPLVTLRRAQAIAEMPRAARAPDLDPGWAAIVFDAFTADLEGGVGGESVAIFVELLRKVLHTGGDAGAWQDVISALRGQVLPALAMDPPLAARAELLFHDLRLLCASVAESAQARHRLEVERWARSLAGTSQALITTFDVLSLVRAAAAELPRLRIRSCFLSLYEAGPAPLETSRLVLGYDEARASWVGPADPVFASRQLAPSGAWPDRRVTFVLEPLFFKEHQLGFVLFEMGPREGTVYEALREQISAALKGALLVQEVVDKDRERERLLADLEKRAHQLERAYQAIQENQEKLLISEKLASLGRLTASIVHEMNTPLAAVRAALVDLGKLVTEYHESAGDPEVTLADHQEITEEMRLAIGLASSAAERAALFVRGIKAQTRDLGPHERQAFNVVTTIRQALLLLGHAMRKSNCRGVFDPPAEYIELHGSAVRFSQVVTNLVENAVDASATKGGGAIDVRLSARDDSLVLEVEDSGTGIAPEILRRIFEPMFTTKPFGQGTGLGLSIVHDIVTGDFGGTVDVESRTDRGTRFTVRFPKGRES